MSAYEDRPMTSPVVTAADTRSPARASRVLSFAAAAWFTVAALGQWLFVVYLVGFYGLSLLAGRMLDWNQVLPDGYTPGDTLGNAMVMTHILLAIVVTAGGTLQLVPAIRRRWPRFHRWNGRVYLATVVTVVLAGLYMVLTREGGVTRYGILLNAAVVLACAAMALRYALARRIDRHRRWALRLFLVVSGVWFFRVGISFWLLVNQGPVGFDPETFTGPFLTFLSYSQTLLPLAILELYLRARDKGGTVARWSVSALLGLATAVTATGIVAAAMILWLPHL